MKRTCVVAIVLAVLGSVTTLEASDVSMGVKGGINISNIRGADIRSDEVDPRYGFTF